MMGSRGGRTSTTWSPSWNKGKTTVIRVPEAMADQIMQIARSLDRDDTTTVISLVTGNQEPHQSSMGKIQLTAKLQELLVEWDAKTHSDDYTKNPRKKLARTLWSAVKSLID